MIEGMLVSGTEVLYYSVGIFPSNTVEGSHNDEGKKIQHFLGIDLYE